MRHTDFEMMAHWLSTIEVLEFYGDVDSPFTLQQVEDKYGPRINGDVPVTPYIAELGESPIGFLQHYSLSKEKKKEFGYPVKLTIYGIDQFIGYPSLFNQGLGTVMVKKFVDYISQHKRADGIILDPEVTNTRAIRCYEKCGFTKVGKIYEGVNWLMEYRVSERTGKKS